MVTRKTLLALIPLATLVACSSPALTTSQSDTSPQAFQGRTIEGWVGLFGRTEELAATPDAIVNLRVSTGDHCEAINDYKWVEGATISLHELSGETVATARLGPGTLAGKDQYGALICTYQFTWNNVPDRPGGYTAQFDSPSADATIAQGPPGNDVQSGADIVAVDIDPYTLVAHVRSWTQQQYDDRGRDG